MKSFSRSFINLIIHISFHTFSFIGFKMLSSDWSIRQIPIWKPFLDWWRIPFDWQHLTSRVWLKNKGLKKYSATGNRTPVSRVTGGDTHHYTIVELTILTFKINIFKESATKIEHVVVVRRWWAHQLRKSSRPRVFRNSSSPKIIRGWWEFINHRFRKPEIGKTGNRENGNNSPHKTGTKGSRL